MLRYGGFYGPGTSLAAGGAHFEAIRKRKFPVVGGGTAVVTGGGPAVVGGVECDDTGGSGVDGRDFVVVAVAVVVVAGA